MKKYSFYTLFYLLFFINTSTLAQNKQLKIGVIGLTHTHVHWIFNSVKSGDFIINGIVEPNRELAQRYADQYDFSMDMVYEDMDSFLKKDAPDAVTAFGTIYEHLEVVEKAAPLGIHVMVEKPLAVSLEHAKKMEKLAKKHNIHLLTNYETTWYPSNHKAKEFIQNDSIGAIRKVIVRDGHKGPEKIGVNKEFLDWLIDPIQNGGGAITDFGCYGVNLMTWLMEGEKPYAVTAITQQMQAENNPLVDDDATILLQYKTANAVIQASWDWPIGRKDMEIYGLKGVIYADNRHHLRVRISEGYDGFSETSYTFEERQKPLNDPFSLFVSIINNKLTLPEYSLSSLKNNMMVMEILDAAIQSAKTNQTVFLKQNN
ncbi:MAG: Gfo/Idh/MocA family oxidoreductase [Saprospiraceae bacterium]|nr:Gfo/Idh/MocA family oxidoreductase [Saprospiraceae bacterium]